jgi:rhodanese-related sulfurtransferase
MVVGAAMGLAFNALRPDPLPWVAQAKATVNLEDLTVPASDPGGMEPSTEAATDATPEIATPASKPREPIESETPVAEDAPPPNSVPVPSTAETRPPASGNLYTDIPEADVPITVSLEKAKDFYDRRGLLVLDARDMEEYGEGHIQGAQAAPYDDKVADTDWMEKTAADPRPILVYCTGGECELSHDLAEEILRTGHRRVMILTAGYADWKDAGYPTATGVTP